MSETPQPIDDLEGLLRALRHAQGALSSQADQIGQMSGMFDDADGAIAAAVEDGEDSDAEIGLAIAFVESLAAARPCVPEVLINVYGGMVQDVIVVEGQPPVVVYVEDNDVEGNDGDPDEDNEVALLQDQDPANPDFHANLYRTSGEAFDGAGRRWTSLRAEAARLEAGGLRTDIAERDADLGDGSGQA